MGVIDEIGRLRIIGRAKEQFKTSKGKYVAPAPIEGKLAAFTKICDLDLLVINLSYGEDRLDRLTEFTGMKRTLIENIIRIPRK